MKALCHLIFLPDARKLRISQDICYVRETYIEFTMTIFGQCHDVLNNKYVSTYVTFRNATREISHDIHLTTNALKTNVNEPDHNNIITTVCI